MSTWRRRVADSDFEPAWRPPLPLCLASSVRRIVGPNIGSTQCPLQTGSRHNGSVRFALHVHSFFPFRFSSVDVTDMPFDGRLAAIRRHRWCMRVYFLDILRQLNLFLSSGYDVRASWRFHSRSAGGAERLIREGL